MDVKLEKNVLSVVKNVINNILIYEGDESYGYNAISNKTKSRFKN